MTPSPLLFPNPQSKQEETWCELNLDSSVHSRVDEIGVFDPDAVDFEPLFVSGSEFSCSVFVIVQ
jgi:hypothetical protein